MSIPFAHTTLVTSGDGSHTLKNDHTGEHYHSIFGALTESKHVFLEAGLMATQTLGQNLKVLEVGLGTGLNLLLTATYAKSQGLNIEYTGLEPFPVLPATVKQLNYGELLDQDLFQSFFLNYDALLLGHAWEHEGLKAQVELRSVQEYQCQGHFDLIYYDAFSPTSQLEMWSDDVVDKLSAFLKPGGILVTYCVRGFIRRRFLTNGLMAERLPGPPGKRQMLRISKPKHV